MNKYIPQICVDVIHLPWHQFKAGFNQNTKLSLHENASESIVCENLTILSRGDE